MSRGTMGALLTVSALVVTVPARADFQAALTAYNGGHFEAAHAQFLALAELGDCSSQFNLGAMALKGQGQPRDAGSAVGWMQAAAGNGCERLVGGRLPGLTAKLSPVESLSAAAIVARYGRDALQAQGIVNPDFSCRDMRPAQVLESPAPDDPRRTAAGGGQNGIVITALTIGVDGLARDPEILLAVPEQGFAAAAVEAWLNSRFAPATRDGQPVESRLQAKLVFAAADGTSFSNTDAFRRARPAADAGDPAAGYLVGLAATLDPSLGLSATSAGQLLLSSARGGDPQAQYWVGTELRAVRSCHANIDGTVWLRHAADGGSAPAQLARARDLIARGTASAAQAAEARALLERAAVSDSFYVRKHVVALLAASPIDGVRNPAAALSVAKALAAGEIQCDPQMFEAIAAAYAANGDFRSAVVQQQAAIRKAERLSWNTRLMSEPLAAYRSGRAWRGDLFAH